MGLDLTAAALFRVRRYWFDTIWGWILCGLAVIVWFFGSDEKRHGDDFETAERRRKANNISRIVAGILFFLAITVDTIAADL